MQELKERFHFFLILVCVSGFFKSLMAPFWVVYFNKIGLTYEQISFLVIVNHLSTLVFEIPTGAIADVHGRKLSVIISLLIGAIVPLGIYFSNSYLLLLFLHLLSGIGATFMSGAFDAWFVDSLLLVEKNLNLTKYWGKLTSFNYLGNTVGFLVGSALVHINLFREIWLIEGIGTLLVFIYSLLRGQEFRLNRNPDKSKFAVFFNKAVEGSVYLFKRKYLLFIVLGSCCFFFSSGIVSLLWQPYLNKMGIPLEWFGPILTLTMVISIFIPRYADDIVKQFRRTNVSLAMVSSICSIFLATMALAGKYASVSYIIYTAIYSIHTPIFMAHINKLIPSSERATIISTYNLSISGITILCTYLFGFLSTRFNLVAALLAAVVMVLLSAGIFGVNKERRDDEW